MSSHSSSPGTSRSEQSDGDGVFTYQGKHLSRDGYLKASGLGPLEEQFIECPRCGQSIHKFSIRCHACDTEVREIGKIDSGPRGSATRGLALVVGSFILAMVALVLAERAVSGGTTTLGFAIGMSIASFLLGVNGLLGLLYFRYFVGVKLLGGLLGFGLGVASFLVAIVLLVLLI